MAQRAEIGMICPYGEMRIQAAAISHDLGIRLAISQGLLEDAVGTAEKLIETRGVEVIISRGGTAVVLRKSLSIPVVSADPTAFDILQTLHHAKELNVPGPIGLMFYGTATFELPMLEKILGKSVRIIPFYGRDGLEENLSKAYEGGVRIVVGGRTATQMAGRHGMRGLLIRSNRETISQAIQKAVEIAAVRQQEKRNTECLRAILNSISDGIITVTEKGVITVFNPAAERLLGFRAEQALGKEIGRIIPAAGLDTALSGKEGESGILHRMGDRQLLVNRTLMRLHGSAGAVYCIQDVGSIYKIEQKIRRDLQIKGLAARFLFSDILGGSESLKGAIEKAKRFAETDATILIIGETGTGKELFAQSIHNHSRRREGPFVAISCVALPETLLESELFGYEDGAFTGARRGGKPGLFKLAHKGTVFLDEIDRMPLSVQARLLRTIQEKEIMPLGSDHIIPVDVRIIGATQQDLWSQVVGGTFLRDLYFRLSVLTLQLPPLRERKDDVVLLAEYFVRRFSSEHGRKVPGFSPTAVRLLLSYPWPGNVRELESFCEQYCLLADDESSAEHLMRLLQSERGQGKSPAANELVVRVSNLKDMENQIIAQLASTVKSRSELAEMLGICRATLWKRLRPKCAKE